MIAVTFALPEESADFRKALRGMRRVKGRGVSGVGERDWADEEIRVVHTGVGLVAAEVRMAAVFADARPRAVISAGFAGGLDPNLRVADLVIGTNFSADALVTVCRTLKSPGRQPILGRLATHLNALETVADKAALACATGAVAVDMETAAIAAACAGANTPLLSVRAISDSADEPLPVPFEHWFDLSSQRPRPFALLAYLARHPFRIAPFARFVRGLGPARRALAGFLVDLLAGMR